MSKNLLYCLSVLIFQFGNLSGQSVLPRPNQFVSQDAFGRSIPGSSHGYPWFVISDRDNNPIYKVPNSMSTPLRKIEINEVLYVLQVSPDSMFLEVAPAKDQGTELFSTSENPLNPARIDSLKGWIPTDRLVMYLESQREGSNQDSIRSRWLRKGIVTTPIDYAGQPLMGENPDHRSPDPGAMCTMDNLYFVFKETEHELLVAMNDRLDKSDARNLLGWIPKNKFTFWASKNVALPVKDFISVNVRTPLTSESNPVFNDVLLLSGDELRTLNNALNILVPDGGPVQTLAQLRISLYNRWIQVLTTVLKLYSMSEADTGIMNRLSLAELSEILTGTTCPQQFSLIKLGSIAGGPDDPGGITNDLFISYMSSFVLTKYCIGILVSPDKPRPSFLPAWFNNYSGILSMFLSNSLGIATPTTQQLALVSKGLPERLNSSFFNLDDTRFTMPTNPEFHQKEYQWVDCRIFPNDFTYHKFVNEIADILQVNPPADKTEE